jgi:hypothetical protein
MVAKLLAPISTKTSSVGDRFTAEVQDPEQFSGAILEGRITKLKAPARGLGKGKPAISFQFDTITFKGETNPVSADLTAVSNSKGVKDVDEEGEVVGKTSNAKRAKFAALGALAGAALGAAAGGGTGAAEGAALGAGAGLLIAVSMTAAGSDVEFYPGSLFTLQVSGRSR